MSNQFMIFLALLFILLNINQTNQFKSNYVVPESSFISLNSREIEEFELNNKKSEVYFSFQNNYDDSDIVINFKVAKGFTTDCYIYDSYNKIETDSQGEYINYKTKISLTEKSTILKKSEYSIQRVKHYIIIKNTINSYYKDYISIFNEEDTILLQNEKFFSFDKFYSKNIYYFSFFHTKNEVVTLELNTDNTDFYQYISILSLSDKDFIYEGLKNRGEITINEDLESEGEYSLIIESEEEPYLDINFSIILRKNKKGVKELKYNTPLTLSYNGNTVFNFYVDIDEYDYEDENIAIFKFGNQVYNRNLLSHCYAKVVNFKLKDDNKLLANMPANEDENEAVFQRLSGNTNLYQLYFKKTVKKEENKKSYLLIHLALKVEEHDTSEYVSPEEFTVFLCNKPETVNLNEYKNTNLILNKNIKLDNYIPQVYKIILPKMDENNNKLSYVFYTSENIQNVYNNTMLSFDNHLYENSKMIYAISPYFQSYDYTNTLYIKLYGFTNNNINLRIESTKNLIYYINNDYREIKTISDKLTDCSKPFYYIGNYGLLVEKGFLYQETLYGNIKTFYKGQINSDDESILINEDSKYLIENNFISLDTSIDIVELQCTSPGFYQMHLMDIADKRDINLYSRIYNYLPAGKEFKISPILRPIQENINFEIYTPKGKEVKINDGEKTTTIDSNNKYYQVKYKQYSEMPLTFTLVSTEDTVICTTLTNKEPFVIVETGTIHVDYDSQIIVKLQQNKKYESVNVVITRVYHGYSYSLFKGNVDFAAKLIESEFDYIPIDRSHKINMTISNPYLRDDSKNEENIVYYLIYSIDDPEMIQKDVILTYNEIKEYEKIDIGKSKTILKENEKYALTFDNETNCLNILYLSCANSLNEINIYNYDDKITTISNIETDSDYQYILINKQSEGEYRFDINFNNNSKENLPLLNGAVIGITNQNITDDDIKEYTEKKLNISQNNKKVEWEALGNNKKYDVLVLNENNTYAEYLDNPCFLESIKNNISFLNINNNDSYIKYYSVNNNSITMKEEGRYIVAVSINVEGKVPLVYIYDKVIYDSSSVKPDENDDEDGGKGTIIFLAIALPIVLIVVLILLIVLIKSKKNPSIELQEPKDSLVRDTTQTNQSEE